MVLHPKNAYKIEPDGRKSKMSRIYVLKCSKQNEHTHTNKFVHGVYALGGELLMLEKTSCRVKIRQT